MDKSQAERELLSVIIAESLRDEIVTVGALADRAARHGFGLLMIVLSLPAMFPVLPPGLPALVGLLFVIVATQMLIGLERPWLPGGVRRYTLSARAKQILQQRGIPFPNNHRSVTAGFLSGFERALEKGVGYSCGW